MSEARTVIWHNPRCSKSRQTLQLLRDRGIEPHVVDYQKTPPEKSQIAGALDVLGIEPRALMRTGEAVYRDLHLADEADGEKLIAAMHLHPVLIERPVVFHKGKAVIGRPPEKVLEII
ncbi:MAG: arsenate reductase (glutaredoxin) [Nitratireductor sp.]|nr:arsenate reductase (glutaredoxin) [Nitratireductor sp.]